MNLLNFLFAQVFSILFSKLSQNKFQVLTMGFPVLTWLGTSILPLPTSKDVWHLSQIAKDTFWAMVYLMVVVFVITFESFEEGKVHVYQTLFVPWGSGIVVDPRSILRIRIERAKVHGLIYLSNPRLRAITPMMHGYRRFWISQGFQPGCSKCCEAGIELHAIFFPVRSRRQDIEFSIA